MSRTRTLDMPGSLTGAAPEFFVAPDALNALAPSGDRGGMIIGRIPDGEPLTAAVLRPQPTRVVTVGGLYLARQIALRAMAIGARVVIATGRPASWKVLESAVGSQRGNEPLVQIRRLTPADDLPRPSADAPLLVVHDGGAVPQELFPPRAAWQTTVYVLPYLHPQVGNGTTANTADLVLLQRLPLNQAELAARIWYFDRSRVHQQIQQLTGLQDDGVIALGNMLWAPIQLITDNREEEILGPIRRGD